MAANSVEIVFDAGRYGSSLIRDPSNSLAVRIETIAINGFS